MSSSYPLQRSPSPPERPRTPSPPLCQQTPSPPRTPPSRRRSDSLSPPSRPRRGSSTAPSADDSDSDSDATPRASVLNRRPLTAPPQPRFARAPAAPPRIVVTPPSPPRGAAAGPGTPPRQRFRVTYGVPPTPLPRQPARAHDGRFLAPPPAGEAPGGIPAGGDTRVVVSPPGSPSRLTMPSAPVKPRAPPEDSPPRDNRRVEEARPRGQVEVGARSRFLIDYGRWTAQCNRPRYEDRVAGAIAFTEHDLDWWMSHRGRAAALESTNALIRSEFAAPEMSFG
jgi:hypothetical protein